MLAAILEVNGGAIRGSGSGVLLGMCGGECSLTAIAQVLRGDAVLEGAAALTLYLTESSVWTGCVRAEEDAWVDVCLDENSSWVVTADSRIRSLQCTGAVTDAQGRSATILGSDGTVYLQGAGSVTVTVDTYGDGCDLSGAGESTGWAAYSDP